MSATENDLELGPGERLIVLHVVVKVGPRDRYIARLLPNGTPQVAKSEAAAVALALGVRT